IQKDFGNGRYQTLGDTFDIPALQSELYEHFEDIDLLFWIDELDTLWITAEIDNYRPIMLYIRSVEETRGTKEYHAVVLDGYMWDEGTFKVHLNYGWDAGNPHKLNESWYEYDSAFPLYNDTTFRQALLIIADPPPQLFGPKTGPPDVTHTFQTKTINRNVSTMYYKWDWGDGTFSDWMGRYASGELCSANHSWKEHGIYPIRVQASDLDQWESKWSSPHTFYIPKYQAVLPLIQILINLIQRFPRSEPLILPLIQRFCT
ncbi:MAG: C10 family peptidase, partial [Candidatus Thermoplasmatota archaeon]|nr:C10 family peptidase [Candidatus Thermoplasmatota archaeon]